MIIANILNPCKKFLLTPRAVNKHISSYRDRTNKGMREMSEKVRLAGKFWKYVSTMIDLNYIQRRREAFLKGLYLWSDEA